MDRESADHEAMDQLDEELDRMRSAFLVKLPRRIQLLTGEWNGLQGEGWNEDGARAFHRAVHGMIGTAGSLGFSGMAKEARQLERRLMDLVESPRAPSRDVAEDIVERIERIGKDTSVEEM